VGISISYVSEPLDLLDLNTVAISENTKHRDNTTLPSNTTYLLPVYLFLLIHCVSEYLVNFKWLHKFQKTVKPLSAHRQNLKADMK
jgi:hypothetical protein